MKSIFLFGCIFLLALLKVGETQNYTQVNSSEYEFQPNDVLVAISPSGKMFRGDVITNDLGGTIDTLRIFAFDENGNITGSADINGFINHGAMESDENRIYLNLELYNVPFHPIKLPGIGTISTGDFSHGSLLVALTHDLDVDWYEFYGANMLQGFWQCDIAFLNNGNLLFNIREDHPDYNLFAKIKEFTPDGNFVEEFTQTELIYTMQEDSEGNVFIAGPCAHDTAVFNGTEVPISVAYNFYIVKYDSDRNYIWSNYIEDMTCSFTDLAVTSNDEIFLYAPLVAGEYYFDDIVLDISSTMHYAVAKLDDNGNFEWAKTLSEGVAGGNSLTNITENSYVKSDQSGNMLVFGSVQGEITWNNGEIYSSPKSKPFVAMVNNEGIIEWVNVAVDVLTFGKAKHIDWSESGALVTGGTGVVSMQLDTILINYDGFFSYMARMQVDNPGTGWHSPLEYEFNCYPNPAKDEITIIQNSPGLKPNFISISNYAGEILMQKLIRHNRQVSISIANLPAGFYFLNFYSSKGVTTKKLVIN